MKSQSSKELEFGFLSDHIGFQVNLSRRALWHSDRGSKAAQRERLPAGYHTALVVIGLNPGIAPKQLAAALFLDPQAMATIFAKLEQSGMALRRRSLTDRRRVEVNLTDEGHKAMKIIEKRSDEYEAHLASNLTQAERKTLVNLLARVREDLLKSSE